MRIGYFTSIEGWGGSETYLLSVIRGVREAGHIPVLFGIQGTRLWREAREAKIECVAWKSLKKIREGDAPVVNAVLGGKLSGGQDAADKATTTGVQPSVSVKQAVLWVIPYGLKLLAGNMREVVTLRKVFSQHRVDVMHVSSSGYEMAGVACRLGGIPSLVMNMITPPPEPYWVRRWLMKVTLRFFDHVSSQSESCTKAWVEFAGLKATRCSYVWNGVDLSRFEMVDRVREAGSDFRIVTIGRLHPMKGISYLIAAVGWLGDPRVKVDILGDGEEDGRLRKLIESKGLTDRVILRGHVEDPESYLKKADCFMLTSVSHESCPAVVPEAMACGLPVITSDFGPLPEINVHGETGLVVAARKTIAIAAAIKTLVENPERAREMGRAGRCRAVTCFGREHMIQSLLGLYAGLLRGKIGVRVRRVSESC